MKEYKMVVFDKRNKTIVYQHKTNDFETLKKWVDMYFDACSIYPFYRYETYLKTYEDGHQIFF